MKKLGKELQRLNEEDIISLEQFKELLSKSYEYEDELDYIDSLENPKVSQRRLSTGEEVSYLNGIMICPLDTFKDIIMGCLIKYRHENINGWIEDYFDDVAFDRDLEAEILSTNGKLKNLPQLIMDHVGIDKCEVVDNFVVMS